MSHCFAPMARSLLAAGLLCAGAISSVCAAPLIYTCEAANGKKLTSDRLIPECLDREQRVLRPDGTLLRIIPPSLTPDERSERDARERQQAAESLAKSDAVKRDQALLRRYPNAAAHQKARELDLAKGLLDIQNSEQRLLELMRERKPLLDEAEFYVGKTLPATLRARLDANEGAIAAQRDVQVNQKAEIERINSRYDIELAKLKKLWAGAPPGSLEPAAETPASAAAKTPPAKPVPARGGSKK